MKKIICIGLLGIVAGTASAELLLSWDETDLGYDMPSNNTLNLSGQMFGLDPENTRGSSDGWFGPDDLASGGISGASTTTASGYKINAGTGNTRGFLIRNNSGQDLELASFLFDYQSIWDTGPQELKVYYGYGALTGITNNTLLATFAAAGNSGGAGAKDYLDFAVDLQSVLTDYVLADGEAATFQIVASDATNPTGNGVLDNIAYTGRVMIPEPAMFSFVILSVVSVLAYRRRRREV